MPQMMPLLWLPLFLGFTFTLSLSLTKIYFYKPLSVTSYNNPSLYPTKKNFWMW